MNQLIKNKQYYKFSAYGFLKNLRFFDAFFILFLVDSGISYTEIGILYAIREMTINIFEIPSGIIADTYGRKYALISSLIVYILSFLILYSFSDFWYFLLAFILYGIADAFRSGTHKAMIMDYLKQNDWGDQKISYYGHTRSWSQKGSAISSLIAGFLVYISGQYESIFIYSTVPYLINLLLIISYPPYLNHPIDKKSKSKLSVSIKSLSLTIKKPQVLQLINTSALHTAYLKAVKDYIQPLMLNIVLIIPLLPNTETEKKSGVFIGIIYFFIYLITSYASKNASKAVDKMRRNIPFLSLLLGLFFGISCGVFYIYDKWIWAIIFFIGIYIIENIRKPILTGFIADQVPGEILASVISVQSLLRTIITAIIALVFGFVADRFGIGVSFVLISSVLFLSSIFLSNTKKDKSVSDL